MIGRKRFPAIDGNQERRWGFVQKVGREPKEIEDELDRLTYSTQTRGERHLSPARPAGEGVYAIARHDDHTHLAFALELPERPGEVQEELNIPQEGSYIVTVKNPEMDSPPGMGLPEGDRPDLPQRLSGRFHGRRFIPVDPPDFLDREGTELVLTGADEDVFEELGVRLDPQHETMKTAELYNELRMERTAHPLKPLFEGPGSSGTPPSAKIASTAHQRVRALQAKVWDATAIQRCQRVYFATPTISVQAAC